MIRTRYPTGSKKRFQWIYSSKRWRELREKLFHERGEQCEKCYSIAFGEIEVHHIKPISLGGDIWSEDNLVLRCRSCHLEDHREIEKQKMPIWQRKLYELIDKPIPKKLRFLKPPTRGNAK